MQIKVYTHVPEYLEGHVGDINQLIVGESQHVEETKLCESSRLDLLYTVMVQIQLLQGREAVKGLLRQSGQRKKVERGRERENELTSHLKNDSGAKKNCFL